MKRVPHWQRALRDEILKHHQPFAWGKNDCCSFVCDCVLGMTGTDIYADFRGKYNDQKSALQVMHDVAGSVRIEDVAAFVTEKHGMKEISPYYAQPGDVVLMPTGEDQSLMLGIVGHNAKDAYIVSEVGIRYLPFHKVAAKAWRLA
ncbi:MAG TPA: hypothetical protein VFN53_06400 [Acidobacteriaceae bacterium]|nr:hypothetical protein [Acidobacteriaceae bacterium]